MAVTDRRYGKNAFEAEPGTGHCAANPGLKDGTRLGSFARFLAI